VAIAGKLARAKARQRTGCRSGVPWPAQALGVLDHRQFGRGFVLSIGEAGNKATTAPGSSGAWWRSPASGPGRRRDSAPAADRACRGLLRLSGCSITGSSAGASSSRSVKPATRRRRRQGRTVPGGDRRQVGQGEGEKRTGCRSGLPWPVVVVSGCGQTAVAAGVARAGSARSPAILPGLRPLDR
jgi:hypothetical protein